MMGWCAHSTTGLPAGASVKVRDAVNHVDKGTAAGSISATVDSHDVAVFVLTPA